MISADPHYDVVIIGSGPAGQNAALEAAARGARALIIERERHVGGSCVQYGTIPSKTLRETAVTLTAFRRRSGDVYEIRQDERLSIRSLMTRLEQVVTAHQQTVARQLRAAGVERVTGRARFAAPHMVRIEQVSQRTRTVQGDCIVIAVGSRPRAPQNIAVDHENILDSDSILSMSYLPRTLTVLGSGVIACEYASTFAALGVQVTMVDKYPEPLGFLDQALVRVFRQRFEEYGGTFRGLCPVERMDWDGISSVQTTLESGEVLRSDKALIAQGRVANLDQLDVERAGLRPSDRGLLEVNAVGQTAVPHIYAVGDAIGPPALASASMEQGRRAMSHAFAGDAEPEPGCIPTGIYTIPELATVGLDEAAAEAKYGSVLTACVSFDQLARAEIMAAANGLLKLVADPSGQHVLGVQVAGEGATELVHLGQMAILGRQSVDTFARSIFNFPTMAEAYRLAAIAIVEQRTASREATPKQRVETAGVGSP